MDWKEEIKQKQDLVNATLREIEEIKRRNAEVILEPLKQKYLNKIIKIDSETYMYVTEVKNEKRIDGISFYAYDSSFGVEYDAIESMNDKYEFVAKDVLIDFINKKLAIALEKIQYNKLNNVKGNISNDTLVNKRSK